MPSCRPLRWIALSLSALLPLVGCVGSTDSPQGETGSLSVDLVLADGLVIDEVSWQITGNGMDMSGDIDVSAPGSTASVEVFGLPPGDTDYTVMLTATTTDKEVTCKGSAPFNVEVGQSTDVMVMLNCKKPRTLGGVRVNGKFNICTELTKAVVSPLQTSVGNDISLSAQAFDEEGDAITYIWTGDGGSIADPSAASTTYTCQEVGDHTVMIMVTDNDVYCRMATWTIPVTCVEGDGGDLCEDVDCIDGNECTDNDCNPASGECFNDPIREGEGCNEGLGICSSGECVPVDECEDVVCEDENDCTQNLCDPADGSCSYPVEADGTACMLDDSAGSCVGGVCEVAMLCADAATRCDDGSQCTTDFCDPLTGLCSNPQVVDGLPCDFAGLPGVCASGICEDAMLCADAVTRCEDGNDCTQDVCDPADGSCSHPLAADGTSCRFDDSTGSCVAGACEVIPLCADAATRCDDVNDCTADTCDPANGACTNQSLPDGATCDLGGTVGVCIAATCQRQPDFLLCGAGPCARFDSSFSDPAAAQVERTPLEEYTFIDPRDSQEKGFNLGVPVVFGPDGLLWATTAEENYTNVWVYDTNLNELTSCESFGSAGSSRTCDPAGLNNSTIEWNLGNWVTRPLAASHVPGGLYGLGSVGFRTGTRYRLLRVDAAANWTGIISVAQACGMPDASHVLAPLPPDPSDVGKEEFYAMFATRSPTSRWITKLTVDPPACEQVALLDGGNTVPALGDGLEPGTVGNAGMIRLRVAPDGTIFFLVRSGINFTAPDDGIWRMGDTDDDGDIDGDDVIELIVEHRTGVQTDPYNIRDFTIGPLDGRVYVTVQQVPTPFEDRLDVYDPDIALGDAPIGAIKLPSGYQLIEFFPND